MKRKVTILSAVLALAAIITTGLTYATSTTLCGGGILGSKNFTVTQTEMQELMASGDPNYSFTLIDSSGNSQPLNFVDGIAVAPTEEGTYTLYASYTEYGTTYYSNGIPFIVKKPDPYWFYFGDTKTLVLKSGPERPAGYGATVTGSGKIPEHYYGISWKEYCSEIVKAVVADEITAPKDMGGWFSDAANLASLKGFEKLDTSNVTDMSGLFTNCPALEDISGLANWDTSHVTTMSNMFSGCSALENISALAEWDTKSVTTMQQMYSGCEALKNISGLANWDTSHVTTMSLMFNRCSSLEDISALAEWETSNVTNMSYIFSECKNLKDISPLADWNTSNVTDMGDIFSGCNSVTNWTSLNGWNVSKVTRHYFAFSACKEPLPSWVAEW